MNEPTIILFIAEADGTITVALIPAVDLDIYRSENAIVAEIPLDMKHPGNRIMSLLADETIGSAQEETGFAGALKSALHESFSAGLRFARNTQP